ncbi:endonuclease III domain-containing protein [Streptococcus pantholopis]|uniref:Deoxyribonuclease I n=1 Tax=Streptococcus pantholopis TaxID=1811193 RepID=A0A172Q6Y4_9STRE|nr:deoxyribonuclease I [Streptococcus pantholopis]AND79224.1 deoxyribonuclease I [Streptococcus pantholopis]
MHLTLYDLYQKMLNTMGPTHWWPAETKEQIIIEAILIQNTTEKNALSASQVLQEKNHYDFKKIAELPQDELEEWIRPAGFMKNKSKVIQTIAQWYLEHQKKPDKIIRRYGKNLRQELLSLHGVGQETADVLLVYIFDQPQFISDKYARTLFTQLGIEDLTDYKSLAQRLSVLPDPFTFQDAQEFHGLIDEFGKKYLRPPQKFESSFLAGDQLVL